MIHPKSSLVICMFLSFILLVGAAGSEGAVRYVRTTGNDTGNTCTNISSPCRTIQRAVSVAGVGDTIRVAQGTYYENILMSNPFVVLTIQGGWNTNFSLRSFDPSQTVINGSDSGNVLRVMSFAVPHTSINVTLEGLSITNGNPGVTGGGVYVTASGLCTAIVTLTNTHIHGNHGNDGGGVYVYSAYGFATVTVEDSRISDNTLAGGGFVDFAGVSADSGTGGTTTLILKNNIIMDNELDGVRASAMDGGKTTVTMEKNTISGHTGGASAGLYATSSYDDSKTEVTLRENIIRDNRIGIWTWSSAAIVKMSLTNNMITDGVDGVEAEAGNYGETDLFLYNNTITNNSDDGFEALSHYYGDTYISISNDIIWGNGDDDIYMNETDGNPIPGAVRVDVSFSDIGNVVVSSGEYNEHSVLNENPLFLNPANANYHLTSDSPCKDTARCGFWISSGVYYRVAPYIDFEGELRPGYGIPSGCDMGADEFHMIETCPGDFDWDKDVDGSDLAVFAADFGRTDCAGDCEGDFDDDNDVDGSDLAVFAADFGRTDCP